MKWHEGMNGGWSLHGKRWTVWLDRMWEHDPVAAWRARFDCETLRKFHVEGYGKLFAERYFYDLERAKLECEEWARRIVLDMGWEEGWDLL